MIPFHTIASIVIGFGNLLKDFYLKFAYADFQFRKSLMQHYLLDLVFCAKLNFHVTHLLQFGLRVPFSKTKSQRMKKTRNVCGCFISGCHAFIEKLTQSFCSANAIVYQWEEVDSIKVNLVI